MEGQAPRGGEALRALVEEIALDERVGHEALQVLRRLPLHAGGDFFADEFEQEIGHAEIQDRYPLQEERVAGEGSCDERLGRSPGGEPVLDPDAGHTNELAHVVGDEGQALAASVPADLNVMSAAGSSRPLEFGA